MSRQWVRRQPLSLPFDRISVVAISQRIGASILSAAETSDGSTPKIRSPCAYTVPLSSFCLTSQRRCLDLERSGN